MNDATGLIDPGFVEEGGSIAEAVGLVYKQAIVTVFRLVYEPLRAFEEVFDIGFDLWPRVNSVANTLRGAAFLVT